MVEAAPQARPEDHFGAIIGSSLVAEYHLGLTSALQHCQHNCAFRFLAAQVFVDLGGLDRHLGVFGQLSTTLVFWYAYLQVAFFKDFGV